MMQEKVYGRHGHAAGQPVQWPGGTATIGAEYDVEGRMSRVTWDGSVVEQHLYDARNRRVKSGGTLQLYGLGGELLGEYWPTPAGLGRPQMVRERIYFAGQLVGTVDGDGYWSPPNTDRLGSLKQVSRRYPFGDGNESFANDEYATYRKDTPSAHYYAWNRYYSATWGRFSSPDPYVMSGGLTNPQGWNRYSYVANDPVNFHDPAGLQAQAPYPPGFCPAQYSYAQCGGDALFWGGPGVASEFGGGYAWALGRGYVPGMPSALWEALEQFNRRVQDALALHLSSPERRWDLSPDDCHARNLSYLERVGVSLNGKLEYGENGGLRWTIPEDEASALGGRLAASGKWSVSSITGVMHIEDVGGRDILDYRSYRRETGLGRSVQIVVGPAVKGMVLVYADTDLFNPNETLWSWLGHAVAELLPGLLGANTSCRGQ
jgi:RHS repeat-associated protein